MVRQLFLRDGIVSAGVPRMTPKNAAKTEPEALCNSEAFDRHVRVLAAARMEPAEPLGHEPSEDAVIERERLLIEADEPEDDAFEHAR